MGPRVSVRPRDFFFEVARCLSLRVCRRDGYDGTYAVRWMFVFVRLS